MNDDGDFDALRDTLAGLTPLPGHPALQHLVESLRQRYPACVQAMLFYGSCLRSGDPYDGLVDLYLIVDRYRCANNGIFKTLWNWLLPPNVFYAEFAFADKTVRCKYAILTPEDFLRGTSRRWFQSYLWGRFSQPTAIAWTRDAGAHRDAATGMAQAVLTLLARALPAISPAGSTTELWQQALSLSYATELRPESGNRAAELIAANATYYQSVTDLAAPLLSGDLEITPDGQYRVSAGGFRRAGARLAWRLRSIQGKLLSLARLSKALFTFDGGLDYIAWKLERHSGETIEIPARVRRYPLIFIWGMVWDLYRRGIFR